MFEKKCIYSIRIVCRIVHACAQKDETIECVQCCKNKKKVRRFDYSFFFLFILTASVYVCISMFVSSIVIAIAHLRIQYYSIPNAFCLKFEHWMHFMIIFFLCLLLSLFLYISLCNGNELK